MAGTTRPSLPLRTPPSPRPPPTRGRGGYSLIELMVVVTLIGIMAAMAAPRFDLSPSRSEAAVHQMGSALISAQRAAIGGQHNVVAAFDVTNNRIRIHLDLDNDGKVETGERIRYETLQKGAVFGRSGAGVMAQIGSTANVSFTRKQDGMPAVTFTRAGTASEEGGVYVTSDRAQKAGNKPNVARAVLVERASGRVSTFYFSGNKWERRF